MTLLSHLARRIAGHGWTVAADMRHRVLPHRAPPSCPWRLQLEDATAGPVTLTGAMRHEPGADTIVVAVHGLGGDLNSGYGVRLAATASQRGWSCLRVNLRGADSLGEDLYHAGLWSDLDAVLRSSALSNYARQVVVGFSLGGHVALQLAVHAPPKLAGVVAIGAPLDLARSCAAIDRRRAYPYRQAVLDSLKAAYIEVVKRHGELSPRTPASLKALQSIRTIYEWDAAIVVPRHGFESVSHYHRTMSVGPKLRELAIPTLYIGSKYDPMVPLHAVTPSLHESSPHLEVRLLDTGGHVAFPGNVAATALAWLAKR